MKYVCSVCGLISERGFPPPNVGSTLNLSGEDYKVEFHIVSHYGVKPMMCPTCFINILGRFTVDTLAYYEGWYGVKIPKAAEEVKTDGTSISNN
jgi:hypothetical protein